MLDSQAWDRLVKGLLRATDEGTLVWEEKKSAAGYGAMTALSRSALSPLIDQRVLRASSKSVTYELTADSFGRAPYELAVWEEVGDRKTPIGTVKSSTAVHDHNAFRTNITLERLFHRAAASTVDSDAVVDRLLGDLGSD